MTQFEIVSVGFSVKNQAGDVFGIYENAEYALKAIQEMKPYRSDLYVKETFAQRPVESSECAECGDDVPLKYQSEHSCTRLVQDTQGDTPDSVGAPPQMQQLFTLRLLDLDPGSRRVIANKCLWGVIGLSYRKEN